MPIFVNFFLFFTLANISFPGTSSFVGEFLILVGSFKSNTCVTFLGATGIIIGGCYSLWVFNRIAFGNLKTQYTVSHLGPDYIVAYIPFFYFDDPFHLIEGV